MGMSEEKIAYPCAKHPDRRAVVLKGPQRIPMCAECREAAQRALSPRPTDAGKAASSQTAHMISADIAEKATNLKHETVVEGSKNVKRLIAEMDQHFEKLEALLSIPHRDSATRQSA